MRILEIRIATHCLDAQKEFYTQKLGLSLIEEKRHAFKVSVGESRLHFFRAESGEAPYYHFAINIPENQLMEAKAWIRTRTPIIVKEGRDEFHFKAWNTDAIYFYDPVGNIVELTARHNLANRSAAAFSAKSLLYISKIGVPVEHVRLFAERIKQELRLKLWDGDEKKFAAVGDEEGLFFIVPIHTPWFPVHKPAESFSIFVETDSDNAGKKK